MGFDINENLKRLPAKPGVYLYKDQYGEIIYIGKAASLRSRVRQYFHAQESLDAKTQALVKIIAEFEYVITDTVAEALILENTLIKKNKPRFNVMLRDDKTYPYLKITYGDAYPRLVKTRTLTSDDGSRYFGPYADVGALNRIIELLNDSYRLKRCPQKDFPKGHRPCLNGFIGGCDRCCAGDKTSPGEYAARIEGVVEFLKGRDRNVVAALKKRMLEASEAMDYEEAAKCRDLIASAEAVTERQKVDLLSSSNMDICLASEPAAGAPRSDARRTGRSARVTVFFVRSGRLTGREMHYLDAGEGAVKSEIIAAFLKQYYANQTMFPKEILLEEKIIDQDVIEDWLSEAAGHRIKLTIPLRGDKSGLLKLAQKDIRETEELADDILTARKDREAEAEGALLEIAGMEAPVPARHIRIEAYDISHTGGRDSVGAMVVFRGTKKSGADYRRFKIRTMDDEGKSMDDYASLQEVIYRRLKRALDGDKSFDEFPDVILVDGGSGHVAAAEQIVAALGLEPAIPVLGMVKDDRHRTRGLIFAGTEVDLAQKPELYHMIGMIQEEVHRFAHTYHSGVRGKNLFK